MEATHLSITEAAERLGVNTSRVRALVTAGKLVGTKIGGRWLVDAASVTRRKERGVVIGRSFSAAKAWGLLMVAAGRKPPWLSAEDLSRVRRALREQGLLVLWPRLRMRAARHLLRAHPSDLKRIAREPGLVLSGVSAAGRYDLDLVAPGQLEGYVPERRFARLVKRYALEPSDRPNLCVRVVAGLWPFAATDAATPAAVVGVDLIEADDPRSRRAGEALLQRAQAAWST